MLKNCIKVEFKYPGMKINSGWCTILNIVNRDEDGCTSIMKISKNSSIEDYIGSTLKIYTLLSRMEEKARVDMMHSGPDKIENIAKFLKFIDHIAAIKASIADIIDEYIEKAKNKESIDFAEAYRNLKAYNDEAAKELEKYKIKFSICLAKYDTSTGVLV